MALRREVADLPPWERPFWPDAPPDLARAKIGYYPPADELVARFPSAERHRAVVSPIETPEVDYADVLIDVDTGEVVGVQVDLLLHIAVARHPAWRPLATPDPPAEAVAALVADVRTLFERYWTPASERA